MERLEIVSPEPSTGLTSALNEPAMYCLTTEAPARVVPEPLIFAPMCLSSISAKKLFEFRLVRPAIQVMSGETIFATRLRSFGAGVLPSATSAFTRTPFFRSCWVSVLAASRAGFELKLLKLASV